MREDLSASCLARSFIDVSARQVTLESHATTEHPRCLMCGPENAQGLRLRFRVQPDGSVLAPVSFREALQSYPEMLHGGVTSALLDAAMTNVLFSIGVVGVTAELTVRFLAPVELDHVAEVWAALERESHPLYCLHAGLEQDRQLRARATARFLVKGWPCWA